jgi:hypothetical protein
VLEPGILREERISGVGNAPRLGIGTVSEQQLRGAGGNADIVAAIGTRGARVHGRLESCGELGRPERGAWGGYAGCLPATPTASRRRTITLRDGARVTLRSIAPDDAPLLAASFQRLSEESRYRRFFTIKHKLSAAELEYFV